MPARTLPLSALLTALHPHMPRVVSASWRMHVNAPRIVNAHIKLKSIYFALAGRLSMKLEERWPSRPPAGGSAMWRMHTHVPRIVDMHVNLKVSTLTDALDHLGSLKQSFSFFQ